MINMGSVRIISDSGNVYKPNQIVSVKRLIEDYIDCCDDSSTTDWIVSIPIPDAVKFIADAWCLEYEFV